MKQIIISVCGALIILQIMKMILPEGTVKKYASFIVGLLVMLILSGSVSGMGARLSEIIIKDTKIPEIPQVQEVQKQQIADNFTSQLREDMKKSIPYFKNAELYFGFEISEDNTGYVTNMTIVSENPPSEQVLSEVSRLYMIDREIIEWRQK